MRRDENKRWWRASLRMNGVRHELGRWDTREGAESARSRCRLGAASPEDLRREARLAQRARTRASRYFGVGIDRGLWIAALTADGERLEIGRFENEEDAAVAVDRLLRHLGRGPLNFPSRHLEPASIEELRRARFEARKQSTTSKYVGVIRRDQQLRPWYFHIRIKGVVTNLGGYDTERECAIARDRAALFHYPEPELNFPAVSRRLGPVDLESLRADLRARRTRATTSGFIGVRFQSEPARWIASIRDASGATLSLGTYRDGEEAAMAYDRAARFLRGKGTALNFPERRLTPRSPAELRARRHRAWKLERNSRFLGVRRWGRGRWTAYILVRGKRERLGTFDDERDAARAYDAAAVAAFGPDAKRNFPHLRVAPKTAKALREESRHRRKEETSSRYVGVHWCVRQRAWHASIQVDGQWTYLGSYDDEERAAEAYDRASLEQRGPNGFRNFPGD